VLGRYDEADTSVRVGQAVRVVEDGARVRQVIAAISPSAYFREGEEVQLEWLQGSGR